MNRLQRFLDQAIANPSDFPGNIDTFNEFLRAADEAPMTKTWCRIFEPEELWEVPKVALLLSDTIFMYGGGGSNPTMQVFQRVSGVEEFTVPTALAKGLEGKFVSSGLFYFPRDTVARWTSDAKGLIGAGRLVYLPERVLLTTGPTESAGPRHWELSWLDPTHPWNVLQPMAKLSAGNSDLVSGLHRRIAINALRQMLELEIPVISEFSLGDYHRLLSDEYHSVIKVRSALQEIVHQLHEHSAKTDDPKQLMDRALKMRDEIVRPEIATLEQQFRRIVSRRSLRMAGATLSTLMLSAGAIFFPDFTAYAAVLGSAGVGAVVKECADFLDEKGQLRDNAYHFLWQLSRRR